MSDGVARGMSDALAGGVSDALAGGRRIGATLGGQRSSTADDQGSGDGTGQCGVADRAERGDQDGPEEEGGGVGQRLQGEGSG
ncbi:hypothetical protein ACIBG4_29810 [Nonomuraea sp. NPDC050383]|uniref:hypothetical protein n=1 Tax=Nonomuraea sp. NPDC050383 TaxID=3364362 RepID=UPI0037989272